MSDHIEVDGKKYFEESYLQIGNETAKRRGRRIAELEAQLAALQAQRDRLVAALIRECRICPDDGKYGPDEDTRALLREMGGENA